MKNSYNKNIFYSNERKYVYDKNVSCWRKTNLFLLNKNIILHHEKNCDIMKMYVIEYKLILIEKNIYNIYFNIFKKKVI